MIHSSRRSARALLVAGAAGAVLVLSSCAAGDVQKGSTSSSSSSGGASGGGSGRTVVVGGAGFTEMQVLQAMYVQLLQAAGYKTSTVTVNNREVYFGQLSKGSIDVVPEYAATLAEYLNTAKNGKDAAPIASADAAATVAAAQPLAQAQGVTLLEPAAAADQNAFAVSRAYAKANNLSTLSDLGALGQPVVLAAPQECATRAFCQVGLEKTYGIRVSKLVPLNFDSSQAKQSVQSGESQVAEVATTDGTLDQFGLVALSDDKKLQLADNLVPAVTAADAKDPKLTKALDSLSKVLTTEDLAALNAQVDGQRLLPADVAKTYLQDKGLLT